MEVPLSDENVIKGFRFCAMMGPDVPESVNQHHNEFHPGPREALPLYDTPDQGIWLPELKSWAELIEKYKKHKQP